MTELRNIKFSNKKVIMRPQNKIGITETWTPNYSTVTVFPVQYIIHDGVRYFLQTVTEKTS
jgi:hypothetical protein